MTTDALTPALTLAWRPFLDPLPLHSVWYLLLIPLAILIAIAYKAVRVPDLKQLPLQAADFTLKIVLGLAGLWAAAVLFVEHVLPRIA